MITLDSLRKKSSIQPPAKKTCTICGDEKEIKDFGKNSKMPDGTFNQCKKCINRRRKTYKMESKQGFFNPNEPAF